MPGMPMSSRTNAPRIWSNPPRGYMALDDRWPVIHARRDFVVEATVVALRPTWPEGNRLKLQYTFVVTQAASVVMAVGNNFPFNYTNTLPMNDRFFSNFESELQHTDPSP